MPGQLFGKVCSAKTHGGLATLEFLHNNRESCVRVFGSIGPGLLAIDGILGARAVAQAVP